jgi:hypothetical protein
VNWRINLPQLSGSFTKDILLIPQRKEVKNMPENKTFEFQMEELEQNAEPLQARMRIQLDVQGPTSSCGCAGGCASGIGE